MSLKRRFELLEWARNARSYIVEDDYDSEYRSAGRPLAALQGLDREGRVLYLGTFSKVMFPALRVGCMVLPLDLVEPFLTARRYLDGHSPLAQQIVLTEFMEAGHFTRHIRRMRALYAERQTALVEAAGAELSGLLEVEPADAGMNLLGWLPKGVSDVEAARRAAARGVRVQPVSPLYVQESKRQGLMLGYVATPVEDILPAVRRLRAALS